MPRFSRRYGLLGCTIGGFLLVCEVAAAVYIEQAHLERDHDQCQLEARVQFQLSATAIETLHSGIPLHWHFDLTITPADTWPWHAPAVRWRLHQELRYLALLNLYQISTPGRDEHHHALTLNNALERLGRLRQRFDCRALREDLTYEVALRAYFDREALPLPLRPWAYLESAWQLSSPWYQWRIR